MAYNNTSNLAAMFNGSANSGAGFAAPAAPAARSTVCSECGAEIAPSVAEFSQKRFGKYLCRNCQPKGGSSRGMPVAKCADCGADVDEKVKEFSERKFKKVLCLNCQKKQPAGAPQTSAPAEAPAQETRPVSNKSDVQCARCKQFLNVGEVPQAEEYRREFGNHMVCVSCANAIREARKAKRAQEAAAENKNSPSLDSASNVCERCGVQITAEDAAKLRAAQKGHLFCPACAKEIVAAQKAKFEKNKSEASEEKAPAPKTEACEGCGVEIPVEEAAKLRAAQKGHLYCPACKAKLIEAQKAKRAQAAQNTNSPSPESAPASMRNLCERCGVVEIPAEDVAKLRAAQKGHLFCPACANEIIAAQKAKRAQAKAAEMASNAATANEQAASSPSGNQSTWAPAERNVPRTKEAMDKTEAANSKMISAAERINGGELGHCSMSDVDVLLQEGGISRPIGDGGLDVIVDNVFPWSDVVE